MKNEKTIAIQTAHAPQRGRGSIGHIGLIGLMGLMGLIGSCTSEGAEDVAPAELAPVGFEAYVGQRAMGTRAAEARSAEKRIPDGGIIGVYAYYHQQSTWAEDEAANQAAIDAGETPTRLIPNFMWNQPVTYNEEWNSFTYSPLKYWPNTEGDKLSFIAYFPYTDPDAPDDPTNPVSPAATGIIPTLANNGTGLPTFEFTVKDDPDHQTDVIVSALVRDQRKPPLYNVAGSADNGINDGQIHFEFRHATPKVRFFVTVTNDLREDLASLKVKSLTVTDVDNVGIYSISSLYNETEQTYETSITTSGQHMSSSDFAFNIVKEDAVSPVNHLGDIYLMLPQTLSDEAKLEITYELTFRSYRTTYVYDEYGKLVERQTYSYTRTAEALMKTLRTLEGHELSEWDPNTQYIYTIRIGAEKVGFTAQVAEWGDTETEIDIDIEERE